jgi:hypothetical protein
MVVFWGWLHDRVDQSPYLWIGWINIDAGREEYWLHTFRVILSCCSIFATFTLYPARSFPLSTRFLL